MARADDEKEHSLGRNCRACGEFVIDTYPGLTYVVDHTDKAAPPQICDLMIYHSGLLAPVYQSKNEKVGLRSCDDMIGVSASSVITNYKSKVLGFANVVAADPATMLKFLQSCFGPISTWSQSAQLTVGYLQQDLKNPSYSVGYPPAFSNRSINNPSEPMRAESTSASLVITQLIKFKNAVAEHNQRYSNAKPSDIQPTKFAPSVLPASKTSNLIVAQCYMTHLPGTTTQAKTHFGYIAFEFPKAVALNLLRYKESYIDAAEQLNLISCQGWNENSKISFLNSFINPGNFADTVRTLKRITAHLKQKSSLYCTYGAEAVKGHIQNHLQTASDHVKNAALL